MKVGLCCFGKNHAIDKYYQILRLYDSLRNEGVDTVILVDKTSPAEKSLRELYDDSQFIDINIIDINSINLDYIIVIDPYSEMTVPYDFINVPIIYKEYGLAGSEKNAGFLINKKIYKYASVIITENEFMKNKILDKYPDKRVVVASPAFDYIFDEIKEDDRFSKDKRNIIWTPHHSIISNPGYDKIVGDTYSEFLLYKDYFLEEFFEDFKDVSLHFKPHPILRNRYNHYVGGFSKYISSFNGKDFYNHEHEDYHNLFMKSDIILNDSISFIQEWLPTGKPMILLSSDREKEYSEYGQAIIDKCYYVVHNKEELKTTLKNLLNGNDPKKECRLEEISKLVHKDSNTKYLINNLFKKTLDDFI